MVRKSGIYSLHLIRGLLLLCGIAGLGLALASPASAQTACAASLRTQPNLGQTPPDDVLDPGEIVTFTVEVLNSCTQGGGFNFVDAEIRGTTTITLSCGDAEPCTTPLDDLFTNIVCTPSADVACEVVPGTTMVRLTYTGDPDEDGTFDSKFLPDFFSGFTELASIQAEVVPGQQVTSPANGRFNADGETGDGDVFFRTEFGDVSGSGSGSAPLYYPALCRVEIDKRVNANGLFFVDEEDFCDEGPGTCRFDGTTACTADADCRSAVAGIGWAGEDVTYAIDVENTGEVEVECTLSDPTLGVSQPLFLGPGGSTGFVYTEDGGAPLTCEPPGGDNTANVMCTCAGNPDFMVANEDTASIECQTPLNPTIVKECLPVDSPDPFDFDFEIQVTNPSPDATYVNCVVDDYLVPGDCPAAAAGTPLSGALSPSTLAPGASGVISFPGQNVADAACNVAQVTCEILDPSTEPPQPVPGKTFTQSADDACNICNVAFDKRVDGGAGFVDVRGVDDDANNSSPQQAVSWEGDDVVYAYVVENTGNVILDNCVITDDVIGPIAGPFQVGAGATVTFDDGDIGTFVCGDGPGEVSGQNIGTLTCDCLGDSGPTGEMRMRVDAASVTCEPPPLRVVKTCDEQPPAGGPSQITIEIFNDSPTTSLANCDVTDLLAPSCDRAPGSIDTLLPGGSTAVNCDADLTQSTPNDVTVSCDLAGFGKSVQVVASDLCEVPPEITLRKEILDPDSGTFVDANATDGSDAPTVMFPSGATYRLVVENTGGDDLTNVTIDDPDLGINGVVVADLPANSPPVIIDSGTIGALDQSQATICDTTEVVPNTATVTAESTVTGAPATDEDPAHLRCVADPGIQIVKEILDPATGTFVDANAADGSDAPVVEFPSGATYRITVTNTGGVDLTNVLVNDAALGIANFPVADLPAGGAPVVLTSGQIPELAPADRCAGPGVVNNIATVSAESAETGAPASDEDPANLRCVAPPDVTIRKEILDPDSGTFVDANAPDGSDAPVVDFPSGATYRLVVENVGGVDLVNVSITDLTLGINGVPVADLPAGGPPVIIDSGDISALVSASRCTQAGVFQNTARVDAESAEIPGNTTNDDDPAHLRCVGPPSIAIRKEILDPDSGTFFDANALDGSDAPVVEFPSGAVYRLIVENTGPVDLTNVVVNDPVLGVVNFPVADLPAGGPAVTIDADDIAALDSPQRCAGEGVFQNVASVDAVSSETGTPTSDDDPAHLRCVGMGMIRIVKEILDPATGTFVDANDPSGAGAPVVDAPSGATYQLTVTNTGPVDLTNVLVNDAALGIANFPVADLPAGGPPVVLTSGQIPELAPATRCDQPGVVPNTAVVTAVSSETGEPVDDDDPANLRCVGPPSIEILKEILDPDSGTFVDANAADGSDAPVVDAPSGATYRITVTNTGPVDLTSIVVNDAALGIANFPVADLPAGGPPVVLTSVQIPELASASRCDLPGVVNNIAAVNAASAETGTPTNDDDPANLRCVGPPSIEILKEILDPDSGTFVDANAADGSDAPVVDAPSGATYRITVTNTGPVDLTSIVVNDAALGIANFPVADLPAGGPPVVLTSVQIPELASASRCDLPGVVNNIAAVNAASAETGTPTNDDDPANLRCVGPPSIEILKEILDPDSGTFVDANAADGSDAPVVDAPSGATYRITVTNTGPVDLTSIVVNDAALGIANFPVADLPAGGPPVVLTSVQIPELASASRCDLPGVVNNIAAVNAASAETGTPTNDDDPANLRCVGPPSIEILKEILDPDSGTFVDANAADGSDAPVVDAPSGATYRITVTNTGPVDLTSIVVNDAALGIANFPVADLPAGGPPVVLTSVQIPELASASRCDLPGVVNNIAAVNAASAETGTPTNDDDPANLRCVGPPSIEILKEILDPDSGTFVDANAADGSDAPVVDAPSGATYRITVTNTGPVDLTSIVVNDAALGIANFPVADLPAGGPPVVLTSVQIPELASASRCDLPGVVNNIAAVNAASAETGTPTNDDDPANLRCVGPPSIEILKEILDPDSGTFVDANAADGSDAPVVDAPSGATYRITVTNTGPVDLTSIVVNDAALGIANFPVADLPAGGPPVVLTSVQIPELASASRCDLPGVVNNIAAVNAASAETGTPTNDDDPANLRCVGPPSIEILKEILDPDSGTFVDANAADGSDAPVVDAPSGATYRITVTNTGPVDLTSIVVNDAALGIANFPVADLPAGGPPVVLTSVQIPELASASRCDLPGVVNNIAAVNAASAETGTPTNDDDPANLRCVGPPSIEILKEILDPDSGTFVDANAADGSDAPVVDAPSGATYRITVTNTGPVDLTSIVVNDAALGIANFPVADLPAGGPPVVLTSVQIPELASASRCDLPGVVNNIAAVNAASAETGTPTNDDDPANLRCVGPPSIEILKEILDPDSGTFVDANAADGSDAPVVDAPSGATYRITVTNTGPVDLTSIVVNDAALGIANFPVADLPAGGPPVVLTSVQIPELASASRCDLPGVVNNIAAVNAASAETGTPTNDDDPANLRCVGPPSIEILKEILDPDSGTFVDANAADGSDAPVVDAPSGATYRITVTNTGPVDLTSIVVNDAALGIANFPVADLPAGGPPVVLTSVQIPELASASRCDLPGVVNNIAAVNAASAETGTPTNDDDPANLRCVDPPMIALRKEILDPATGSFVDANATDGSDAPVVDQPSGATYRLVVENTGGVDLTNVTLNDPTLGIAGVVIADLPANGPPVTIDAGTIPALISADRCAGPGVFPNTASVDAVSAETGTPVDDSDPANLRCVDPPSIAFRKEIFDPATGTFVDANAADGSGAPVVEFPSGATYRLVVENTGTVDLMNVTVSDASLGIDGVSIADLPVGGGPVVIDAGTIPGLVAPSRCSGPGVFPNTASVDAASAETGTPVGASDPAHLRCVPLPGITLKKQILDPATGTFVDADDPGGADAPLVEFPSGAVYRLVVENVGGVDLFNVTVNDASLGIVNALIQNLLVGSGPVVIDSGTIPALDQSTATRCDGPGVVPNTASVDAVSSETGSPVGAQDPAHLRCVPSPEIAIRKEILDPATGTFVDANAADGSDAPVAEFPSGAVYRLVVENTGQVALTNIVIDDPALGIAGFLLADLPVGSGPVVIDAGTIPGLDQSDVTLCDAPGVFPNEASVSAASAETGTETSASDPANLLCVEPPCEIDVEKTCCIPPPPRPAGDACQGKVLRMVFEYTDEGCEATTNDQSGKAKCSGHAPGAPVSVFMTTDADKIRVSPSSGISIGEQVTLTRNDGNNFGSTTAFDVVGPSRSQWLEIHTSCSKALNVGDQFGSVRLVLLETTEGGVVEETVPEVEGTMCLPPGFPEGTDLCDGDKLAEIVFEYTGEGCQNPVQHAQGSKASCEGDPNGQDDVMVIYTGKDPDKISVSPASMIDVGDTLRLTATGTDSLKASTKLEILEPDEAVAQLIELHTSCSQPLRLGDEFGALRVVGAVDESGDRKQLADPDAPLFFQSCSVPAAPPSPHCTSKPKSLTLRYLGGDCSASQNGQDDGSDGRCSGGDPGPGPISIQVLRDADEVTADPSAEIFLGDNVTFSRPGNELRSETEFEATASDGASQRIRIHTSCSKPLNLGDRFGAFEIFAIDRKDDGVVSLGGVVEYQYTVTNLVDDDSVEVTRLEDDQLGDILEGGEPLVLGAGESATFFRKATILEDTRNWVVAGGRNGAAQCFDGDSVMVTVEPPPPAPFTCDKPIDGLTMIWNGLQDVRVRAWKGDVGSTLLADEDGIVPGQEVEVTGYAGSPNDVIWQVFEAGTTHLIGESTFHLSCSDGDMNGVEDCGKVQGDGKDKSGFLESWLLEGMVDQSGVLDCTPDEPPPPSRCGLGFELVFLLPPLMWLRRRRSRRA